MKLFGRLIHLQLLADGAVRTYSAVDPETKLPVLLHLRNTELLDYNFNMKLRRWLESNPTELLDKGEWNGQLYLVTRFQIPFHTLEELIEAGDLSQESNGPIGISGTMGGPSSREAAVWQAPMPYGNSHGTARDADLEETKLVFYVAGVPMAGAPVVEPIPAKAASAEGTAAPATPPGEFTRMFSLSSPPTALPEPSKPAPAKTEPGAFTQLFQTPARPSTAPVQSQPSPGEFTRLFQPPTAPKQPIPEPILALPKLAPQVVLPNPSASQAAVDPGQATRLFDRPEPPVSVPPPPTSFAQQYPPAPAIPTIERNPFSEMEFAKRFNGPLAGSGDHNVDFSALPRTPRPAAVQHNEPGDFTRMFGGGVAAQPGRATAGPDSGHATQLFYPPSVPQAPSAPKGGPGEYTRMFASPSPSAPGATPAVPNTPPPAKANQSNFVLIVAAFGLFVLAVALILFFLLRR